VTKHSVAAIAAQLADREAIKHCVLRYCRGLDRLDEAMLREVYWPEATDDHITYSGSAEGFIEVASEGCRPYRAPSTCWEASLSRCAVTRAPTANRTFRPITS
jgi:hypothetical protein